MDLLNIFISYNRKNRRAVEKLVGDLEILGHTIWYDEKLTGGRIWWDDILKHIRESELFIFVVTVESLKSVACIREFEYALQLNKNVLPILMGGVKVNLLPGKLQMRQIVNYHHRGIDAYQKLIQALRMLPEIQPMPNPLPAVPEAPISPLVTIKEMVQKAGEMTRDEQIRTVAELRDFILTQPEKKLEIRAILRMMRNRGDIYSSAEREALEILTPKNVWTLEGHTDAVQTAAYSRDGRLIVTGSRDGVIRIWESDGGQLVKQILVAAQTVVFHAEFNPTGNRVVTATADGLVRVWSLDSGHCLREIKAHPKGALCASYSTNGRTIVTAGADHMIRVWSVRDGAGQFQLQGHASPVNCARFSPDSTRIVSAGSDGSVRVWDAQAQCELRQLVGHSQNVFSVVFSPDGTRILTASEDGTARLWDAETGKELRVFRAGDTRVFSASFNRDGRMIVTAHSDGKAHLWEPVDGFEILPLEGHKEPVYRALYSPVHDTVVTASADKTALIWDVADLPTKPA
jgi:hypothetical protein